MLRTCDLGLIPQNPHSHCINPRPLAVITRVILFQLLFFSFETWGLFRESPETFRAYFGRHNSLCIFKTKASRGTKPCSYFYFYSLYNIWKDQLYTISRSQFYKWLFGPEKSSGLSRNARLVLTPTSVLEASHSGNTQKQRNISPKIGL